MRVEFDTAGISLLQSNLLKAFT